MKHLTIFDKKSAITKQYKIFGVPTVIIADKGGTIVFRQHFVPEEKDIKALLK